MERKWAPLTEEEFAAQLEEARERGRIADETEPRAAAAHYNRRTKRIEVELTDGCLFAFPVEIVEKLRGATAEQLAQVEVWAGGAALHWEELDVDYSVPGLLAGRFGTRRWMSEMARQMGRATSARKAAAARENGKKGGRPRREDKKST